MARGARPASYGLVLSKVLPHIDPSRYEVPKAKSPSAESCCRRPPPIDDLLSKPKSYVNPRI